jgi:hypothetical protein
VAQGLVGLKVDINDPDFKQTFFQAYNQFESGLMQYGASQLCLDVYTLTRESAEKGLGVLMVPK